MRSRRNYFSSVFCLFLAGWFLFNTSLHSFIHTIQIEFHRHSQWERLEEAMKTETLVFSTQHDFSRLVWVDEKEFYYDGRLYDFRSLKMETNQWIIQAVNDEKEHQLKISFAESWNKSQRAADSRKFSSAFQLLSFMDCATLVQLPTFREVHPLRNADLPQSHQGAEEPPPPRA
jgi:hypothetical protein